MDQSKLDAFVYSESFSDLFWIDVVGFDWLILKVESVWFDVKLMYLVFW